MKTQITTLLLSLIALVTTAQNTWNIDASHTNVNFEVSHMVISDVEGTFKTFDGTVISSESDFSDAKISFTVDVNSIDTDNEMRDNHLKSPDFFEASKYEKITFTSTKFTKVKGENYLLEGDLTIKGITKKIQLDVVYNGTIKDPYGNTRAGFKLNGKINRFDYGLKWNATLESGGLVVGEEVSIEANVEVVKAK